MVAFLKELLEAFRKASFPVEFVWENGGVCHECGAHSKEGHKDNCGSMFLFVACE